MHTNNLYEKKIIFFQQGVSLLELVFFIVIVAVASGALFATYNYSLIHNTDPIIQVRALEFAQAKLDEVIALKYDENTPTGGVPACGSIGAGACNNAPDSNMNDVDDFNNVTDTPYVGYMRTVTVVAANNIKLITVTVSAPMTILVRTNTPMITSVTLAAFKANF